MLVHIDFANPPAEFKLLTIELPETDVDDFSSVDPFEIAETQELGGVWLRMQLALCARVPSVVAPHSFNYLVNPTHPDIARAKILRAERHPFDPRLIG